MIGPGSTVSGRYQLGEQLGIGGMGSVYRGRDLQLGRDVAIKVMARHIPVANARARFEREARVGAQLNHPHIIQTLDFGVEDNSCFLVLQLATGGDLLSYVNQHRPLALEVICRIGAQLASALGAAHERGIVHRDLKPENVLVDEDGSHVRLGDFGMAYLSAAIDPRDGRLTCEGAIGGTPMYMAPEQVAGHEVGPAVDIYALGCLLFELVAGSTPFEGATGTLLAKQLYAPPPRLSTRVPTVSSGLDELVDRMLAKSPVVRPSASVVRARLEMLHSDPRADQRALLVSDRQTRMISINDDRSTWEGIAPPSTDDIAITTRGELDENALVALAAAGFATTKQPTRAWVAIGQSFEEIAALVATGVPVVADCPPGDVSRVAQLIRLGVAEVVLSPIMPHLLVRKLQRALTKGPS